MTYLADLVIYIYIHYLTLTTAPAAANIVAPSGSTAHHVRQDGDECLISGLAETFTCFADDVNVMDADVDTVHFKMEWYEGGDIAIYQNE